MGLLFVLLIALISIIGLALVLDYAISKGMRQSEAQPTYGVQTFIKDGQLHGYDSHGEFAPYEQPRR